MTATPADIALYTNDGVVITAPDPTTSSTIRAIFPDAPGSIDDVIESFCDNAADAQVLLNEKFSYVGALPVHEQVEVETDLGLGSTIPVTPQVPSFRVIDEGRGLNVVARVIVYAKNFTTDRYAVEVIS